MSFTPDELKKTIETTLNQSLMVPPGHKGAFVIYYDDSGVRTAVAAKIGEHWQIQGAIGWHEHSNGLDYGANVMATW